jgi:hypothetical protein
MDGRETVKRILSGICIGLILGWVAAASAQINLSGGQGLPALTATTASIGGSILIAGACTTGTVAVPGATTSMVALVDPQTYPGDGTIWDGQVTSAGTVTVKICAIIGITPQFIT